VTDEVVPDRLSMLDRTLLRRSPQFAIRREAYRRNLAAFREHGIELVGRGVVVKVEGSPGPHAEALGAAAVEAIRPAEAGAA
jgi:hypothetical protein